MEEMREGAAGFRQVQEWVAEGRYPEAVVLLEELLIDPSLGRSQRAQLHALACWILDGPLEQSGPRAVLHGEEAVRLSESLHDPWHRAEAQAHLTGARLHMGDLEGARAELGRLEADVAETPGLLSDEERTLFVLTLLLAAARGEWAFCLALLADLDPQPDGPELELELIRAWATLQSGAPLAEVRFWLPPPCLDPILEAERALLEARLARAEGRPINDEAIMVAGLRLAAAGRRDVLRRLALPEAPVDERGHGTRGQSQDGKPEGAEF
ncbi:MAG TPA: hypothetical protein VK191_07205 [Symbiobacteriaceae bacterium]|nr:hypothetical protein [Symbiobacteriaceae bacterium]